MTSTVTAARFRLLAGLMRFSNRVRRSTTTEIQSRCPVSR
ncbi:Uncharacterised protein [Vibrio cholerae]|nr:Uncharacterised protein [Vibrio cholerae]